MEIGIELAPLTDVARLDRLLEALLDVVQPGKVLLRKMRRGLRQEPRLPELLLPLEALREPWCCTALN